ncbi:HDOD domain-containing protein [Desulfovibrio sp. OttesenSCG-928-C14]|nr:HDOD domain-containing protein [Desulfovibrio sp. OttesenSCG-928-C14]
MESATQVLTTGYKDKVLEANNLPAMPDAVHEITRLMSENNCSTDKVAAIIEREQALAAKVLKMVNSPIYGFPGRITNVSNALVLLGINVIRGLIISTSVFDPLNKHMSGLWKHSVACSLASVEVAKAAGLEHPEDYSVMGLLHDIGKVIFLMQIPEARQEMQKLIEKDDLSFREAEKKLLGFTHEKVNAWLCEHWNLPLGLKEAMSFHHSPMQAKFNPEAAAVVHLADFMARLFECGSGGDENVPPLDPKALKLLNINHKILESILDRLLILYSDSANLSVM